MKCNACGQDRQPRIELRQHGETDVHVGGATGMRLMYVCSNVECNSVLGPHDKPAAPPSPKLDTARANLAALAAERGAPPIELSSAEMAEAAGNAAALIGQPVSYRELPPPAVEPSDEAERLRVQLAGCLTVAEGNGPATTPADYGWSPAYQAVLELRQRVDNPSADEIEQSIVARLAFVEAEIERLRGYVREGDKLRAMLEAIAPASGQRAAG